MAAVAPKLLQIHHHTNYVFTFNSCNSGWKVALCRSILCLGYPAPGLRPNFRTFCHRSCPPDAQKQPRKDQNKIILVHYFQTFFVEFVYRIGTRVNQCFRHFALVTPKTTNLGLLIYQIWKDCRYSSQRIWRKRNKYILLYQFNTK